MQTVTRHGASTDHSLIASDRVEGAPVRRSTGEKVGTIQRLMIDKLSGNVAYAVLSFGGFLGLGEKHLPVPWARLKYSPELEAYEVNLTDEEFGKAPSYPAYEEFDWDDRERERELHNYYKVPPYWGNEEWRVAENRRSNLAETDLSDRLARIKETAGVALGDPVFADKWLRLPNPALKNRVPIELARTDAGAREVEVILSRIAHGDYS